MSKSAYNRIVTLLPQLEQDEMREVSKLIDFTLKGKGQVQQAMAIEDNIHRMDEEFYRACIGYVNRINGTRYPAIAVMKKKQRELFMQVLYAREEVDKYEEEWIGGKHSRARKKFYGMYCRVVGRYILDKTPAPLTLKTLVQFVDEFPAIMDTQFPGYVASGTAKLVLSLIGTRVDE